MQIHSIESILEHACISESGCWNWTKSSTASGYAQTFNCGKVVNVSRVIMNLVCGHQLSKKEYVCHKCDNPLCINPEHLFIGSNSDNIKDAVAKGRHYWASKTCCKNGHQYSEYGKIRARKNGSKFRECTECSKSSKKKHEQKKIK